MSDSIEVTPKGDPAKMELDASITFEFTRGDLHRALDSAIINELKVQPFEAWSAVEFALNITEELEQCTEPEALVRIASLLTQYPKFLAQCKELPATSFQSFPKPFPIDSIA